jgi:hypothetical protein
LDSVSAARRANLVADSCPGGALLRTMMANAQLHKEGVAWAVLSAVVTTQLPYSPTILETAHQPRAGRPPFFSIRQDAQRALPVGTDRTTEQSPAALETNDADGT